MKYKIVFSILLIPLLGWIFYRSFQYCAPPSFRQPYLMKQEAEDTLRIAYIGDSWAYWHNEHKCQIAQLLKDTLHRPVKVHSYGICGLTSKEIYENMYEDCNLKDFLTRRRYEYCYVSAGINDSHKMMSIPYYQQSISNIIQLMLINNIHPIIQEIPDYDIKRVYDLQKPSRKIVRRIFMLINNLPLDCKQRFRDALDDMIHEKGYQDRVSIIRYKAWNNNYSSDLEHLYSHDHLHINENGYAKLDSVIAKEILKLVGSNSESQTE